MTTPTLAERLRAQFTYRVDALEAADEIDRLTAALSAAEAANVAEREIGDREARRGDTWKRHCEKAREENAALRERAGMLETALRDLVNECGDVENEPTIEAAMVALAAEPALSSTITDEESL